MMSQRKLGTEKENTEGQLIKIEQQQQMGSMSGSTGGGITEFQKKQGSEQDKKGVQAQNDNNSNRIPQVIDQMLHNRFMLEQQQMI